MARKPATETKPQGALDWNKIKRSPLARELFAVLLNAVLNGVSQDERRRLAELKAELDSDGDGVADANDADPNNAAVQ